MLAAMHIAAAIWLVARRSAWRLGSLPAGRPTSWRLVVRRRSRLPTARDRLYAELAADVAELEQRGSILKRVVKLVTPAVVHIEARREAEAGTPAARRIGRGRLGRDHRAARQALTCSPIATSSSTRR